MDEPLLISDAIPRRYPILALWLCLGLAAVAGLEYAYFEMPRLSQGTSDGRVAAFDLDGEGSLGAWFSSSLLLLAGLVSLVVFSLRRQRKDDYRGRYRMWFWAAVAWIMMSADESGSLHEGFKELMTRLTGERLFGDGSLWWAIPYATVLSLLGLCLMFDMRGCWSSSVTFVLAGLSLAASVVWQLGLLMPESGARGVMVEEGCEMVGYLLLLFSMTLYARHVVLQIEGRIPVAGKKLKKKTKKTRSRPKSDLDAPSTTTAGTRTDKPQGTPSPKFGTATPKTPTITAGSASGPSPLSRAERKKLRRQERRSEDE